MEYSISNEELLKAQKKLKQLYLCYSDFCNKHGLKFFLCGGAAIGAIREHNFLPWDDDIDVLMPRPDYEKFCRLWNEEMKNSKYVLCRTDRNVNYHHCFLSIADSSTTFICTYNTELDICHGIELEIEPIDGAPDSKILQFFQVIDSYIFALFNFQRLPNNQGKVVRLLSKVAYILVPFKKWKDNLWVKAEKRMSKYSWDECSIVKELWGKTALIPFDKSVFETAVMVRFDDMEVPVMAGYDCYLSRIFGDYMTRPPVSDQVAKHDIVFADMDHPYTDYKGIYYFPKESKNERKGN